MTTFRLITSGLLPVILSVVLYRSQRKTKFGQLPYMLRQIIIGMIFGALAVLSTEFGIDIGGAAINVRDAAPLSAALIFGGPAGIIAGIIGGVERWFAVLWGAGEFTQLACSIATICAGIFGAAMRRFLFENKRPPWFYALAIAITTEVLHMLLIFLTNMSDIKTAFSYVQACSGPMILANSVSVLCAVLCVSRMEGKKTAGQRRRLAQVFQKWLLTSVSAAFVITGLFTFVLQTEISKTDTASLLSLNISDVPQDLDATSDNMLMQYANWIAVEVNSIDASGGTVDTESIAALIEEYEVPEIHLVGADGRIYQSSDPSNIGYDLSSNEQAAVFLNPDSKAGYMGAYQPSFLNPNQSMKYAGIALEHSGLVLVGYDAPFLQEEIAQRIKTTAKNRHVGTSGYILITNTAGMIVSDGHDENGNYLAQTGIVLNRIPADTVFEADVYGMPAYCMYSSIYTLAGNYKVIAVLPESEALFSRDIALYVTLFMETLIFMALFFHLSWLVKHLVVDKIRQVNHALDRITGGDLNVAVDVRSSTEFDSLSSDINATVSTLKQYIADAAARIDQELEFARTIQHSALPSVFPPYPNRTDFEIFARMDTAKEVGGDFYDFYLLNPHTLVFLIADVSGKGIPAAMFMMTAKTHLKNFAESGLDVDEIFNRTNAKLCENNKARMFVTAWMGMLDLTTGRLRYANAGHNPILLKRASGRYEYLKSRPDFILAGLKNFKYHKNELQLLPGDAVYLYTDGVTEAHNADGQLFGEERLLASVNDNPGLSMEELCQAVKQSVDAFTGDAEQFDDITMTAVKLHYIADADTITTLPDRDSVPYISSFAKQCMEKLSVPAKAAHRIYVAVDEIYANIVHYSGAGYAEMRIMQHDGRVNVIFRDNGTPYNPLTADLPDTTLAAKDRQKGGLGIFMVRKLMNNVQYIYEDHHNVLTLTLDLNE